MLPLRSPNATRYLGAPRSWDEAMRASRSGGWVKLYIEDDEENLHGGLVPRAQAEGAIIDVREAILHRIKALGIEP